ncbi:hypothetical protein C0991_001171 [Blastosporella zonata]|nr:hypothetical protein C0991_001171 [Blastosporella zonata]
MSLSCASETNASIAIREYDAKLLLAYWLERAPPVAPHATIKTNFSFPAAKVAQISWDPATNTITPDTKLPNWVFNTKLVAKPDQLIKRRGKAGLLALNKTWDEAKPWIAERAGKPQKVCTDYLSIPLPILVFFGARVIRSLSFIDLLIEASLSYLSHLCRDNASRCGPCWRRVFLAARDRKKTCDLPHSNYHSCQ